MTSAEWAGIAALALPGLWLAVHKVIEMFGQRSDPKNRADSASVLTHAAAELATSYVNRMDQMEADHEETISRIETKRQRDKDECDAQLLVLTTQVKTLTDQFAAASAAASEKAELVAKISTLESALAGLVGRFKNDTDASLRDAVARLERSAERGEATAAVVASDLIAANEAVAGVATNLADSQHRADGVTEGQPGEAADAGAQGPKESQ